jgi:HSP20 family molecular chaperone IbpA
LAVLRSLPNSFLLSAFVFVSSLFCMQATRDSSHASDPALLLAILFCAPILFLVVARAIVAAYGRRLAKRRPPTPLVTSYDLSVSIDNLGDLAKNGWIVRAPLQQPFVLSAVRDRLTTLPIASALADDPNNNYHDHNKDHQDGDPHDSGNGTCSNSRIVGDIDDRNGLLLDATRSRCSSEGRRATAATSTTLLKTVAFLGMRGVGKTFCINRLYGLDLEHGPFCPTPGISIVWPRKSDKPAIVDTAGDCAPAPADDTVMAHDRHLAEFLIEDVALSCADQVVLVVRDMTRVDQQRLTALADHLARQGRRHLFVVHNLRHAADMAECDRLWRDQVVVPYSAVGHLEHHGDIQQAHFVSTIKGVQVCHMRLAREGTAAGDAINGATCAALCSRLDALGVARPFDPCALIDEAINAALPRFVSGSIDIEWQPEGALAGDAFVGNGADDAAVIARIRRRTSSATARDAFDLRLRIVPLDSAVAAAAGGGGSDDHYDGDQTEEADFEVPLQVVDRGAYLAVRIDVPGVDTSSLTVTSVAGPRGQYAHVRGQRRLPLDDDGDNDDTAHERDDGDTQRGGTRAKDPAPQAASLVSSKRSKPDAFDARNRRQPERDPLRKAVPAATVSGKKSTQAPRSIVEPSRRCGRICARVDMPPGSCIDASTIVCADGVLSFKIRRQVQPIHLAVTKAPAAV